jgi:hypothetical protein
VQLSIITNLSYTKKKLLVDPWNTPCGSVTLWLFQVEKHQLNAAARY